MQISPKCDEYESRMWHRQLQRKKERTKRLWYIRVAQPYFPILHYSPNWYEFLLLLPLVIFFIFSVSQIWRAFTSACLATFAVFAPTSHIFLCRFAFLCFVSLRFALVFFLFILFLLLLLLLPQHENFNFNTGACVCWKNKYQSYAPTART